MASKRSKPDVPALLPHEVADLRLRQVGQRVQRGFLEGGEAIWQARQVRAHEHYGFADPVAYAEARTGLRYRTLARLLAVYEATLRVPEPERPEVVAMLTELGSHKAAVLAAAIGDDKVDWRELAKFAKDATEEALQSRVSVDLGRERASGAEQPGERLYRYLLANCPPEAKDLVEMTFEAGFKLTGSKNAWSCLLAMCEETAPGWLERVEKGVE